MFAVLKDAVDCLGDARHERQFRDALAWVLSETREQPFAFESICDTLGLDASYLRRGLSVAAGPDGERAGGSAKPSPPCHRGEEPAAHAR